MDVDYSMVIARGKGATEEVKRGMNGSGRTLDVGW